jgi:translation initiation factor 1A
MVQNGKGGKKGRRGKKPQNRQNEKANVVYADEGQVYACVKKRTGGTRLQVECSDGKIRSAIIPGRFRKRVWMNPGDILLVSLNIDGTDNSCTIDNKYNNTEASVLRSQGLITFEETREKDDKSSFEFASNAMDFSDIHGDSQSTNVGELPDNESDGEFNFEDI